MKILSLSYFAEIWAHSYPEFLVYKSLNEKYKYEIDYVNCEKFLSLAWFMIVDKKVFLILMIKKKYVNFVLILKKIFILEIQILKMY